MITVVRSGAFSGSAISLVSALRLKTQVQDVDVMGLGRRPEMLPARVAAVLESQRHGQVSWAKTASWTSAVQKKLERKSVLGGAEPVLFIQSLIAAVPSADVRYGIYTDRVGHEGANVEGAFASRFSPGWLDREKQFLEGAERVFVMGPSTKKALISFYGVPGGRISVVGAGPNCHIGEPVISTSCTRLLFVGTQWDLKGGPELLDAFVAMRREHPDLELIVVGITPPGSLPPGVRVVGRVPSAQMDALYGQVDALVVPTHMEAFGISIVEALMKGIPCVGTTVGNQPWIIGDAGICVDPANPAQLVRAVGTLIDQYPTYKSAATTRGNSLRTRLSWDSVASTVLRCLIDGQFPRDLSL